MPEHRLSILHISDLHARSLDVDELPQPAREGRRGQVHREAASRARVLGAAWADNLRTLYPNGERPDLVCFTGDVADWGLAAEYTKATELIDELVAVLRIARSQVYVVPGNHDAQRYTSAAEWTVMRELLRTDARTTTEWLAGGEPPRAIEDDVADAVMLRTAEFWRWVEHGLGRPELLPVRHPHGRLGYHHVPVLPQLPFDVHVIGLDSAWLAGDDHDQGKLWLTDRQRDMLLHDKHGQPWTGFRLALVHHPIEELAQPDIGPARRGLARTSDLLLHGHQHDPVGSNLVDLHGDALRVLAAGCLYEGTEGSAWKNGCQRIDVLLDDAGRPLRAEIWFRAWSNRGHWYSDSSLYRGLTDGRMVWDAWGGSSGSASNPAPSRSNAGETQPGSSRADGSSATQPEQAIDNRGASVAQQVNVYGGNVTLGATSIVHPGGSEPSRSVQGDLAPPPDAVAARLETFYGILAERKIKNEDTAEIDAEILELRRRKRHGPTLHPGEHLDQGRFRLLEVIGQGGFAVVWKAYDNKERRLVAVKVLHGELARVESRRERLFRGAKRMAELQHPNVVRVLVAEGEEEGFYYFVMELITGGDLHRAVTKGKLDGERALAAIDGIADALAAAHASGLVHRDVKPENILLREDGAPVLSDFDLVQARDTTGGTRTTAMGSVLYAAPEQNEDASRVDHRADVYSLGMAAVFCIYGKKLPHAAMFERDTFLAELECKEAVREVLQRAVALNVEHRFESMTSFRQALAAARQSEEAKSSRVEEEQQFPPGLRDLLAANPLGELHHLRLGMIIEGKWELHRLLGRGLFGDVYEAWDIKLDRPVGIKVLSSEHGGVEAKRRLMEEAPLMEGMSSEHLVRALNYGELPDGSPYFVMDLVKGKSLRHWLKGHLPVERVVEIAEEILDGLNELHKRGVVHGDIKPENIIIGDDNKARLLDFGLVQTAAEELSAMPHYMAPEMLFEGTPANFRTDVYAIGVVLYEMLTGRLPRGHHGMGLSKFLPTWWSNSKPNPVLLYIKVPAEQYKVLERLDRLILDSLAREPILRPKSAFPMLVELRQQRSRRICPPNPG